jgi:hypothetical protein
MRLLSAYLGNDSRGRTLKGCDDNLPTLGLPRFAIGVSGDFSTHRLFLDSEARACTSNILEVDAAEYFLLFLYGRSVFI